MQATILIDFEATGTNFARTKPVLHEDEDEARYSEAEAETFGLEATLASSTSLLHTVGTDTIGFTVVL